MNRTAFQLLIFPLTLALVLSFGQSTLASQNLYWYSVPAFVNRKPLKTGVFLGIPRKEIGRPLASKEVNEDPALGALRSIYEAVLRNDVQAFSTMVRTGREANADIIMKQFADSLNDFKEPFVDSLIQRPGGVKLIVVKGSTSRGEDLRLYRFRLQQDGSYKLEANLTPSTTDSLLAETLQAATRIPQKFPILQTTPYEADGTSVQLEGDREEATALKLRFRIQKAPANEVANATETDAWLRVYIDAYESLFNGRNDVYLNVVIPSDRENTSRILSSEDYRIAMREQERHRMLFSLPGEEYVFVFFVLDYRNSSDPNIRHEGVAHLDDHKWLIVPQFDSQTVDAVLNNPHLQNVYAKALKH